MRENRINKTDRSDFESIIHLIFNRFKAIKDEKSDNFESARHKKSQVLNKESMSKTHKFDKKLDKVFTSLETKSKSKNNTSQFKDSKSF